MKNFYLVLRFSLRQLWRQKWQTTLLIIGILLGVAVVIAIDYSNQSSKAAINLSAESITGKSTHQIVSSGIGVQDELFSEMKRNGILNEASPIVEGFVNVLNFNQQPFLLLGIDPFLDYPFRSYYGGNDLQLTYLVSIIAEKDTALVSKDLADEFGVALGDKISYIYQGRESDLKIVGFINSNEPVVRETIKGIILVDISTAQSAFNKIGFLDRVEMILKSEDELQKVQEFLPDGLVIRSTQEQNFQQESMIASFQLNLTALSLLALIVGGFLIYNTMTFSVVQRIELIGLYRSLGFHKSEIFTMVIFEALVIGVIGTFLGVIVGSILGKGTVNLILQTINDLYFVTNVKDASLPVESIIKGIGLGIFITIFVSIPPAIEATQITPRMANIRSDLEDNFRKYFKSVVLLEMLLVGLASFLLFSPLFRNIWWAFLATFFIVIAFSVFTAITMYLLLPRISRFMKRKIGMIPGMATRDLYRSLSRTSVAVASLMVAVAVTIGMTLMINSFRSTVSIWLMETLGGDIYISVPNQFANRSGGAIDEEIVSNIIQYPQIEKYDTLLTITGITENGDMQINVISNDEIAYERIFSSLQIPKERVWEELQNNKVLVSEPLANRISKKLGDQITLHTPIGLIDFEVLGIFSDYTSSQGYLMIPRSVFNSYWINDSITALSLILDKGINVEEAVRQIKNQVVGFDQQLIIRSNKDLRSDVLVVFDRTFAITNSLRLITTVVSFIGILSATLIILNERKREFGILKAIGMKTKEIAQLILYETGFMGLIAGIFAIPTGIIISVILVFVINLRSFGWTIQFNLDFWSLSQGILIALVASLLASIYPLIKIHRLSPIEVIRNE